jgi:hypothetical protein
MTNGFIDYVTLLNERDGGIHGVPLVWEECEAVWDATRAVECYERLKAKGPLGTAVFPLNGTPFVYALLERATHDQIPLLAVGVGRTDLQPPGQLLESEHGQDPVHRPAGRWHGAAQGCEDRPCLRR